MAWLAWLTPFGWMDHLAPFGDPQLPALLVLVLVPVLLLVAAASLRNRRDTGGALLGSDDSRRPRLRGLGGPAIFAWRSNLPVLTGWVLGLGAYAFVLGALLTAQPFAITSAAVMALIGCTAGACGVASFSRRDLTGA